METQFFSQFVDSIYSFATFLLFPALCFFAYQYDNREYGEDVDEQLYELSKFNDCSEFDIFCNAGNTWRIVEKRVENDFDSYLMEGSIPHYVQDYVRKQVAEVRGKGTN